MKFKFSFEYLFLSDSANLLNLCKNVDYVFKLVHDLKECKIKATEAITFYLKYW